MMHREMHFLLKFLLNPVTLIALDFNSFSLKMRMLFLKIDVDVFFVDPSMRMIDLQIQEGNQFQNIN